MLSRNIGRINNRKNHITKTYFRCGYRLTEFFTLRLQKLFISRNPFGNMDAIVANSLMWVPTAGYLIHKSGKEECLDLPFRNTLCADTFRAFSFCTERLPST